MYVQANASTTIETLSSDLSTSASAEAHLCVYQTLRSVSARGRRCREHAPAGSDDACGGHDAGGRREVRQSADCHGAKRERYKLFEKA
jgi:hypothetical protein